MRTRGIVGRRIAAIEQVRVRSTPGRRGHTDVVAIVLDNGIRLVPLTIETDTGEYDHTFVVCKMM